MPPPPFDRQAVLAPDVVSALVAAAGRRGTVGATKALAQARAGQYGAAAMGAFEAGDQVLAAFLKGVDLYAKGQLDGAAGQLQAALRSGPHPPAMFLLAACFAASGRDAEAASYWQSASAAGETRLRRGETALAVPPLRRALAQSPGDGVALRWLALAEAAVDPAEGLPRVVQYLDAQPQDADVLLAAMQAIVDLHTTGRAPAVPLATKERFARYAAAYPKAGAERALVDRWVSYMNR